MRGRTEGLELKAEVQQKVNLIRNPHDYMKRMSELGRAYLDD
jgi:hypothetical protein